MVSVVLVPVAVKNSSVTVKRERPLWQVLHVCSLVSVLQWQCVYMWIVLRANFCNPGGSVTVCFIFLLCITKGLWIHVFHQIGTEPLLCSSLGCYFCSCLFKEDRRRKGKKIIPILQAQNIQNTDKQECSYPGSIYLYCRIFLLLLLLRIPFDKSIEMLPSFLCY